MSSVAQIDGLDVIHEFLRLLPIVFGLVWNEFFRLLEMAFKGIWGTPTAAGYNYCDVPIVDTVSATYKCWTSPEEYQNRTAFCERNYSCIMLEVSCAATLFYSFAALMFGIGMAITKLYRSSRQ